LEKLKVVFVSVIIMVLLINLSSFTNNASAASTVHVSVASQTATSISLSWTKTSDIIFKNYAVTYSSFVNGPYITETTITDASQTSYAITGLTPNTPYYFIIQDTSNDILSSSTQASNTLQANTNPTPILSNPSKTSTTVSLQWSDYNSYSSTVPFESYVVQMSVAGGQWSTLTTITDVSQSTYTVTGLSPATYQFRMYDKAGSSGEISSSSNTITVHLYDQLKVQINNPYSTPVNVGQQVQLTAQASGGSGSYNYQWYKQGIQMSIATFSTYSFSPESSGYYSVRCVVTDSNDASLAQADASVTLTATATTAATATPTPTTPEFPSLGIVALFIVLSLLGAIVITSKKSKTNNIQ
jgi:hypothetical protein